MLLAALSAGCGDEFVTSSAASSSVSSSSTGGGGGSSATNGGGGTTSTSSTGGEGGAPPHGGVDCESTTEDLDDDGLVARFFMDEAAAGQGPGALVNAVSGKDNLVVSPSGPDMEFDLDDCNCGLRWIKAGDGGRAVLDPLQDSILRPDLQNRTSATFEIVLRVVEPAPGGSPLFFVGDATAPKLSLSTVGDVAFTGLRAVVAVPDTAPHETHWAVDLTEHDRSIVHLLFDSDNADPQNRIRLHLDGVVQPRSQGDDLPVGTRLDLTGAFIVGNGTGASAFEGWMYYLAIYDKAVAGSVVTANAGLLAVDDDRPAN